jgi:hypothetical protein
MAEQGLVASIFGKTVYELQQERIAERKKQMAAFAKAAASRGESSGIASGGFLLGSALADKIFPNTKAMEKAKQAEEQQAALNAQLSELDRTDPKRFYLQSDAYNKAGNIKAATDYLRLGQELEFIQQEFNRAKAEKNAARAAESEKRKTLYEAYPNNPQAQKMALAGFTVDQIEKLVGAKKPKSYVAKATEEDISQVSSMMTMNDIDFGGVQNPVVTTMIAEDLARMKNDYKQAFEEGQTDRPWMGDTLAINSIIRDYTEQGKFVNDPSWGPDWRFDIQGSKQVEQEQQPGQNMTSAVQQTFPQGLPNYNNTTSSSMDNYENPALYEAIKNIGN